MRIHFDSPKLRAAFACTVLFAPAWGQAGDVFPTTLGNCIPRVANQGDFGVRICEAKIARDLMLPGSESCAASRYIIRGRLVCTKSDSASHYAGARPAFRAFSFGDGEGGGVVGPVSITNPESFYANKNAGDNGRFRVARYSSGLRIEERGSGSRRQVKCRFARGDFSCVAQSGGGHNQAQTVTTYALRLDGLEVSEDRRPWACLSRRECSMCFGGYSCTRYGLGPVQKTSSFHPWN